MEETVSSERRHPEKGTAMRSIIVIVVIIVVVVVALGLLRRR